MASRKIIIDRSPFENAKDRSSPPWVPKGVWLGNWIWCNDNSIEPITVAFKRGFEIKNSTTARIHVSADERYILYLDGVRVGAGPDKGDKLNWFFNTYDLELTPGRHMIVATVWADRQYKSWAQISVRNGFMLIAEDSKFQNIISTGLSNWKYMILNGMSLVDAPASYNATGRRQKIDGFKIFLALCL